MKVTLRKAHEYQARLNQVIKTIEEEMPRSADIMFVDDKDIESTINDASNLFDEMLNQHYSCLEVIKKLRFLVADANHEKGIDSKLTLINFLERKKAIKHRLSQSPIRENGKVLKAKLESKRDRENRYHDDAFNVSIFDQEDISDFKQDVRRCDRRIRELKEEVLALNITTYVEVDDRVEDTLRLHDLI